MKQTDRLGYLASSSFFALMLGGVPAAASCFSVGAGDLTVFGPTAGICVSNASFHGSITVLSGGGLSSGISFTNGTMLGSVSSAGTIVGGISLDPLSSFSNLVINGGSVSGGIINQGTIGGAAINTAILVENLSSFSGGISNSGSIIAAANAIMIESVSNFSGGISNSGGISVSSGYAIEVNTVSTFSGGITNSGTIVGQVGIAALLVSDFSGGISNSGTISAGSLGIGAENDKTFTGGISNSGSISSSMVGIEARLVSSFNGNISNSGSISAATGINIIGSTINGGITDSGTILASSHGILIDSSSVINSAGSAIAINGAPTFTGGISNAGLISAVSDGIFIGGVSTFSGGINNSGTIAATIGIGIGIFGVSSFTGGIVNSGLIQASNGAGIFDNSGNLFQGGISNSGTISALNGIFFEQIAFFLGGISNSGVISAQTGINVTAIDTFAGNISNAGTISGAVGIFIGGGVSFSGGAIYNSGTIIGTTAAIDASGATSPVTIDQTGGLISGAIKLSNNADVVNISGGTISGNIIGQGSSNTLNFNLGSGTFTYDAAYQFTGINQVNVNSGLAILDGTNSATNVTVNGGTLEVGDASHASATLTAANGIDVLGGTLAGHGTVAGNVNIASGGTLRPGGSIGTLTIDGDLTFNAGSSYTIDLSPTQHSQTNVIGTVTINGGSVVLTPQLGTYAANRIAILTSTGALTGAFSPTVTYSSSVSLNGASLSYDGHDVYLSNLYSVVGGSPPPNGGPPPPIVVTLALPSNAPLNAQNAAGVLNNFILAGGTVPGGFQNLTNLSGNALNTAANQLGGQGQGAFAPLGFAAGNQFLGLMLNPYVEGRGAGFGPAGAAPLAYVSEEASAPAARAFNALALDGPTSGPQAVFAPRLSIWSSAYGGSGSITGNGFTGAASTDSQIYGVATGLDYLVEPNTVVGLALGGGGTAWQSGQGMGSGHSSMFQGGIYGTSRLGPAYVSGAFAYAQQDVTTNRVATLAGYDVLQGNFTANVVSGRLESGYRLPYGFLAVTPYGAVQTQAMFLPAYSEHAAVGSSQFALSYTSRTFDATRTEAGAWLDSDYFMSQGVKLYGRLAWAHDFDNEGLTTATFQSLSGSAFVINSVKPAHDGALVTAGFEYRLIDGWSVLGKFDGEYSATTAIFAGTGTLRKVW
mgnify:CR=1 FL=1